MNLLFLLLTPAFAMSIIILTLRQTLIRSQIAVQQLITYSVLLLGTLGFIWGLARLDGHGTFGFILQIFVLPSLLVGIAGLFLYMGWHGSVTISQPVTLISIGLLVFTCFLVFDLSRSGGLAILASFLAALTTTGTAIVIALWLGIILVGRRKSIALFIGILLPLGLFFCVYWGDDYSPEETTRRNGDKIIEALEAYNQETGEYPAELSALVPDYLRFLPEVIPTQKTDWMYTSTSEKFTLGYWFYPDNLGSDVCLYHSREKVWDCGLNNWGPFPFFPTPGPQGWESFPDVSTPQP